MKKFLLALLFCLSPLLFLGADVSAQTTVGEIFGAQKSTATVEDFTKKSGLRDYTEYDFDGKGETGTYGDEQGTKFRSLVRYALDYLKQIFVGIAVLFFVWGGAELIIGRGTEESFKEKKNILLSSATGFILVILAGIIIDKIFFGTTGEFIEAYPVDDLTNLEDNIKEYAQAGAFQLQGLFQYFTSWVVLAGVGFLVFSAGKMILAAGEDEAQISNLKKRIVFTMLGMVLIISADRFIELFRDTEEKFALPKFEKITDLIVDWINFALGFVGVLAIVALIWGGIRLITNFGEDEQSVQEAKRTIFSSILGLIIAFSCWTLVYFFVAV